MNSRRNAIRASIGATAAAAVIAVAAPTNVAAQQESFAWRYAKPHDRSSIKSVWRPADVDLFKAHVLYRAGNILTLEEISDAYDNGAEIVGGGYGDVVYGTRAVKEKAYRKWAVRHPRASCEVFGTCVGDDNEN